MPWEEYIRGKQNVILETEKKPCNIPCNRQGLCGGADGGGGGSGDGSGGEEGGGGYKKKRRQIWKLLMKQNQKDLVISYQDWGKIDGANLLSFFFKKLKDLGFWLIQLMADDAV